MRHGAIRARLRQKHGFFGIEQLSALAHELDAAEHNGLLGQTLGELGEIERVTHIIGNRLHLGCDIVVRKNHRIALGLELFYRSNKLCRHKRHTLGRRRCRRHVRR